VLSAPSGAARKTFLDQQVSLAEDLGYRVWLLSCSFEEGGLWAGVKSWLLDLLERSPEPDLVRRHDYEIVQVLPHLKRTLEVRNPTLTDIAPPEERVRNYPADRAYRIAHGLVDFLEEWKVRNDPSTPWLVVCDQLDRESKIALRFFRELLRRRGKEMQLSLLAGVEVDGSPRIHEELGDERVVETAVVDLPGSTAGTLDVEEAERRAVALEERVGDDIVLMEDHIPELIRLWEQVGRGDRILRWKVMGQSILNILGFYQDALTYGYDVLAMLEEAKPENDDLHWPTFNKIFSCHVALGEWEKALHLAEEEVLGKLTDPYRKGQLDYLIAMLYARYMPERDLDKGEEYLEAGVEALRSAQVPEFQKQFEIVFNRNGLAMIRHFQGRLEEAIQLCRDGYETLERYLTEEKHRLHRSVLLYNIAQVFAAMGSYEEALRYYDKAIEMDPNYSEYYNEVGNIYLRLGRLAEAHTMYLKAIELSPPYFEVWANLGQSYRLQGELRKAVEAYSRALDLEPNHTLALVGRAQAYEALGVRSSALADYSAAIELEPEQWQTLANRAVLFFEEDQLDSSLEDLDRALELAPEEATLYQNRAFLLGKIGRHQEAASDLRAYLELAPGAEDRSSIETQLAELGA